jgi:guanylate kinase
MRRERTASRQRAAAQWLTPLRRGIGRPSLFVVSAPSGSGKTTLCQRLLSTVPGLARSVSVTTRPPRRGEISGHDYWFVTEAEFLRRRRSGEFLEWAKVFGAYYGTLRRTVERSLHGGRDVLLSIDVQGAAQVRRRCPEHVSVFILPPSMAVLRRRLLDRGLDTPQAIRRRLTVARRELRQAGRFDYAIVNEDLEAAVDAFRAVVMAERARVRAWGQTPSRRHQLDKRRGLTPREE